MICTQNHGHIDLLFSRKQLISLIFMGIIYENDSDFMRFYDYSKLEKLQFDSTVINLLTSIHEAKGRQELYIARQSEEMNRLVEIAKIQSVDASNDIKGIRTTETRLKQLISKKTTPKNRDALNIIHESFDHIELTPNYILQLHSITFKHVRGNNLGGHFKNVQNYIQGIDGAGNAYTVFTPLTPHEIAPAIENLSFKSIIKPVSIILTKI